MHNVKKELNNAYVTNNSEPYVSLELIIIILENKPIAVRKFHITHDQKAVLTQITPDIVR